MPETLANVAPPTAAPPADPGEFGPAITPRPAPRPSAPPNPRSVGYSPAIEQREAAAARAGEAPPAADQQPPPAAGEKVKVGDMEVSQAELQEFFKSKGERELKAATLPASPADYKTELPADFKAPEGVSIKFDEADPLLIDGRNWAHSQGFDQSQWSQMLALYAGAKAKEAALLNTATAAEVAKLGVNGTQRVTALEQWLRGMVGDRLAGPLRSMMVTSGIVEGLETLQRKFSSQGAATFSQAHRTTPDDNKIPGYDKMSFEQKREVQDRIMAARRAGR